MTAPAELHKDDTDPQKPYHRCNRCGQSDGLAHAMWCIEAPNGPGGSYQWQVNCVYDEGPETGVYCNHCGSWVVALTQND